MPVIHYHITLRRNIKKVSEMILAIPIQILILMNKHRVLPEYF